MLLWDDIKDTIRDKGGKPSSDFIRDNMTFKFDIDDYIPLGKVLEECKYKND